MTLFLTFFHTVTSTHSDGQQIATMRIDVLTGDKSTAAIRTVVAVDVQKMIMAVTVMVLVMMMAMMMMRMGKKTSESQRGDQGWQDLKGCGVTRLGGTWWRVRKSRITSWGGDCTLDGTKVWVGMP